MTRFFRLIILVLSVCALTFPALSEQLFPEETPVPQAQSIPEEAVIAPAYPVPDYVEWLLEAAGREIGYTEEKSGYTKYGAWSGDATAEWCAEFLCWTVNQVEKIYQVKMLNSLYPNYTGTNTGRNWFLRQGRYIARRGTVPSWGSQWFKGQQQAMAPNSYVPQPGDWVFFSNNALGDTMHVAMVEYCAYDEEGKIRVHVIEGNSPWMPAPQAVTRNSYAIDHWAIQGYGTVRDLADIVLRQGNEGAKVSALQQALVDTGYLSSQYVTGKFGSLTLQAVKDFQKKQNIEVSGVANHETQQALFRAAEKIRRDTPGGWVVED